MFASVWQLLTAIFFFSALTKLIYKLIKEDRTSTTTRRIVIVRAQQPQQHLEQDLEGQQQQLVILQQQAQQAQEAGLAGEQIASLAGRNPSISTQPPPVALGAHQHSHNDHADDDLELDEDDEFEETLSWAFQSPIERAELEEQRRARWLTRQQFRRQLNRLHVAETGELHEEPEQEGEADENESDDGRELASSLGGQQAQQQQSPTSSGEFFDAIEFSPSGSSQHHAAQHREQHTQAHHKAQTRELQPQASSSSSSSLVVDFECRQIKRLVGANRFGTELRSDRSEQQRNEPELNCDWEQRLTSTSGNLARHNYDNIINQNEQHKHNHGPLATASQRASNLTKLIGETFLIEPLKLTCAILGHTFRTFCALLDFIEGIETPGQTGSSQANTPADSEQAPSGRQRAGCTRWSRNRWSSVSQPFWPTQQRDSSTRGSQVVQVNSGQDTSQLKASAAERSRSNYFHRRYTSRRSLSAALLNDSDRDEPEDDETRSS